MSKTIYFVAGEASGDNHGAALMRALRERDVDLRLLGRGGPQMKKIAGGAFNDWIDEVAILGWWEVVKHWGFFREKFEETLSEIATSKPDAVVLVDYPGFNLRLARALNSGSAKPTADEGQEPGPKIIYYISPQVWAWNRGRIKQMARMLDLMICIFPFERPLYEKSGLKTVFVGYPYIEELAAKKIDAPRESKLVGLFPGSRDREIRKIFPVMLETARLLQAVRPDLQFEVAAASTALAEQLRSFLGRSGFPSCVISIGQAAMLMQRATAGLVASGTATVEAAYFQLPFAIVYRLNWVSYVLARLVVRLKWIGMVNILAGKGVVREFIQARARPHIIAKEMWRLIDDREARVRLVQELDGIIKQLGGPGASQRAAAAVLQEIGPE